MTTDHTHDSKRRRASVHAAIASMAMRETVVVVGNGMVGHRFCELLTAGAAADRFRIAVFGEEPIPAYNRIRLSEMLCGQPIDDLLLAPRAWYEARHIDLYTGDPVVAIDRPSRTLRARSGKRVHYDRVVLATGASPRRPALAGIDEPGVLTYRDVGDLAAIRGAVAAGAERAAIIGGGVLGIELAWTLADLGVTTKIFESATALMGPRLDRASAGELKNQLEDHGIEVAVDVTVSRIVRDRRILQVITRSGEMTGADLVVVCAGVIPRDTLARCAGLRISDAGGVWVGDDMRTSDPRIYAIGDCARHRGAIYGQIAPGYQMATVAAGRLCGERTRFLPPVPHVELSVGSLAIASIGDMSAAVEDTISARIDGSQRALAISDNKLAGACAIGPWPSLATIEGDVGRHRLGKKHLRRFARTGEIGERRDDPRLWPDNAIVCRCERVTRGEITHACAGKKSLPVVMKQTGAGLGCGSCQPLVARLCGGEPVRSDRRLLWVSLLCASLLFAVWALPAMVTGRTMSHLFGPWRDHGVREISGFVLLGVCALGLLMPIARRFKKKHPRVRWMKSSVIHAVMGAVVVVALFAHTGQSPGGLINITLATTLTAALGLGALLGSAIAVQRAGGLFAPTARIARWPLLVLHVLALALLPALICIHVLSVYMY